MNNFKTTALCIALSFTTLTLTACDKGDKKATSETKAVSTTATTTTVTSSPVSTTVTTTSATTSTAPLTVSGNTAAATATIDQVMSVMGSSLIMANKMSQQTEGKAKFTPEQIDCMATKGNDVAVMDMQGLLQQNFSEAEMKQLNDYFASTTGKKQAEMTKNMVAAVVKEGKDLPKVEITATEKKEMEDFWKSATGVKLNTLLKDKEKLRPMMAKIIDKKQVDCNLPKANTSEKPNSAPAGDTTAK